MSLDYFLQKFTMVAILTDCPTVMVRVAYASVSTDLNTTDETWLLGRIAYFLNNVKKLLLDLEEMVYCKF